MECVIELQRHAIVIKAGLAMTVALVQIALIFALGRGRVLTAHASAIVAELVSNIYIVISIYGYLHQQTNAPCITKRQKTFLELMLFIIDSVVRVLSL